MKKKQHNKVYSKTNRHSGERSDSRIVVNNNDSGQAGMTLNTVLIFLFILFLPTQLGKHFFFDFSYLSGVRVDYLAPTIYFTDILAFILTIVNFRFLTAALKNKKVLLTLILLFLTILFAQNKNIFLFRYVKILELILVFLIFKQQHISRILLLSGFLIGGVFELLLSILQLVNKHSIEGFFYLFGERPLSLSMAGIAKASLNGAEFLRPYGTFSHPNSLGGFYLLIYFFILTKLNLILEGRNFLSRYLRPTLLFVCTTLILLSFSKLTISTFLLLNFVYVWRKRKDISCKFCTVSRILILAIVSFIFLKVQTDPLTLQKRYLLLKNALEILQNNFLLGIGLGNYLVAQSRFHSKFLDLLNQPVHNIFILYLSELGVLVSVCIGFLLLRPLQLLVKKLPYIFAAFLLTGFFDHYWITLQQNFLLIGVLFGVGMKEEI